MSLLTEARIMELEELAERYPASAIKSAVAEVAEACAVICERWEVDKYAAYDSGEECARAIREALGK